MLKNKGSDKKVTAQKVLQEVYNNFLTKGKEIKFPKTIQSEVNYDDYPGASRKGYMHYQSAIILCGNKGMNYAVLLGKSGGGYASMYGYDIAVVPFAIPGDITNSLEENGYFHHSLVYSKDNGSMMISPKLVTEKEVANFIIPSEKDLDNLQLRPGLEITSGLKSPFLYKKELSKLLFDRMTAKIEAEIN